LDFQPDLAEAIGGQRRRHALRSESPGQYRARKVRGFHLGQRQAVICLYSDSERLERKVALAQALVVRKMEEYEFSKTEIDDIKSKLGKTSISIYFI
jgi:hypothetical protein